MPVGHRLVTTCNKEMADKMCEIGELGRLVFSLIDQLTQVQEEREILARKFESVRKDVEVVKQESSRRIERLEQEIAWLRVELAEERTGKDRTETPWRQVEGVRGRSDRAGSWRTPVSNQFVSLRDEVGIVEARATGGSRGGKSSEASGRGRVGPRQGAGGQVGPEDKGGEMVGEGARRKVRGCTGSRKVRGGTGSRKDMREGADGSKIVREGVDSRKDVRESADDRKGEREGADGRKEVREGAGGRMEVREGAECRKEVREGVDGGNEVSGGAVEVKGKVVVIGDSQVRFLDRVFCDKDRKNRISVCFLYLLFLCKLS